MVKLLSEKHSKQIWDEDPDLNSNFALLEGRPIQIDVGRFRKAPLKGSCKDEVVRVTDHLHQWLMHRSTELDEHLRGKLDEL